MSGIAAILYLDGRRASRSDIERVARSLRPYGIERQNVELAENAAFAYAHFTDTLEAIGSRQPLNGGGGRFKLLFDGRLDNREELATELGVHPERLRTYSDADLALKSWERWRSASMSHWVGDFAYILWDKSERCLTAARDHFGGRTLHYSADSQRVIIASAPKCIHALGDLPREIDDQKIADALSQLYHDGERTFFKGIKRIPPASFLVVSETSERLQKYYNLEDNIRPIRYKKDDEYVEEARELFLNSVRANLRSHRPIGAFLSGGLDSSSMAVYAANELEKRGKRLKTFTSVPEAAWDKRVPKGMFGDESDYVKEIKSLVPSIELNFIDGAGLGHYHRQEELLFFLEMPVRNALNLHWTHAILEEARECGISVMLQGVFGNATLSQSGDGVYGEFLRSGSVSGLVSELAAISNGPKSFAKNVFKHMIFPLGPKWIWLAKQRLRGGLKSEQNWNRFVAISKAFSDEMGIPERAQHAGYRFPGDRPQYERKLWLNLIANWMTETGDILQGLRAMYGIDIRDPFQNRRIVEWSFGVPETQFRRKGIGRWLIRRMMDGQLPDSILRNNKIGLQTADWHLRLTRDLPAINRDLDLIVEDSDLSRMIDTDKLRNLINEWPEKTITNSKDARMVQMALVLPMTLQIARFFQREKGVNLSK